MKYVITGGPCSGKTTLINKLKQNHFNVVEEAAREVLAQNKSLGLHDLQKKIYDLQIEREKRIDNSDGDYFLDRGWIDNQAYFKQHADFIPPYFLQAKVAKYSKVFLLERLPLVNDDVRQEDEATAASLHKHILKSYILAGYRPVIVPAMLVEDRKNLILAHIHEQKEFYRSLKQIIQNGS